MFIGDAFNFPHRGKLQAPAAGLAVIGVMLMFGVAQAFQSSWSAILIAFAASRP
jgi:hypothetical protein